MRKYIGVFFVILLALNFGCDSTTEPESEKSLKGVVKDFQGNLLSDAKVFIIYDFGQSLPKTQNYFNINKLTGISFVELTSFSASVLGNSVKLSWSTATELENLGFEIQTKTNTIGDFNTIGFVAGSGTTTEVKNYSYTDANVIPGSYTYRLKAIAFDSTYDYSNTIFVELAFPTQTLLEQNYPNPFDNSTTISFVLRKPSSVTFDINDFNNNPKIPAVWQRSLPAGYHRIIFDFSILLPSNGYKIVMTAKENDGTSFLFEKEFILVYTSSDSSIFNNIANAISQNGIFEIKYSTIPLGHQYTRTSESDPSPIGILTVSDNIKLVVYKPGYKIIERELTINPNVNQDVEFQLETE